MQSHGRDGHATWTLGRADSHVSFASAGDTRRRNPANLCWAGPYCLRRSEWRGAPRGAAALFENFWGGVGNWPGSISGTSGIFRELPICGDDLDCVSQLRRAAAARHGVSGNVRRSPVLSDSRVESAKRTHAERFGTRNAARSSRDVRRGPKKSGFVRRERRFGKTNPRGTSGRSRVV